MVLRLQTVINITKQDGHKSFSNISSLPPLSFVINIGKYYSGTFRIYASILSDQGPQFCQAQASFSLRSLIRLVVLLYSAEVDNLCTSYLIPDFTA